MDLKVYDFNTGRISFSKSPRVVDGIEQLTQYIAKLLIQEPGSNIYCPDGGEGVFSSGVDIFLMSNLISENVISYISSQDEKYQNLDDTVKMGTMTNISFTPTETGSKIDIEVYSLKQIMEGENGS